VLPPGTPLLVTVTPQAYENASKILAEQPDAEIIQTPNRGRDIAPFMALLNSGKLDGFDAVLKIHTKRSPHLRDGNIRRKLLFLILCGEANATRRALAAFCDPTVGMVGWRSCYRSATPYWTANRQRVAQLAEAMSAGTTARLGFFEGSMFWFRPKALEPLRKLSLSAEDFEPEEGQVDGALHHAIERCFTIAAWSAGYDVRDLQGRVLTGGEFVCDRLPSTSPTIK
jgi:lipopolysaccharide biosynthesis protein